MGTEPPSAAVQQENESTQEHDPSSTSPKLTPGTFVQIVNLKDHVWMEGRTGRLVEEKWGGKWLVDLDNEDGKRSQFRKRWLVPGNNVQIAVARPVQYYQSASPPEIKYNVVGSWDNWSLKATDALKWDPAACCVYRQIDVGDAGVESFQILVGCDWHQCIHPNRVQELDWQRVEEASFRQASEVSALPSACASKSAGMKLNFVGPDRDSHGKNWQLGQGHEQGARYELRMTLWEDETVASMEIELKVKPENKRTYASIDPNIGLYLVGSWNEWKPAAAKRMLWDAEQHCLKGEIPLSTDGLEKFQILIDRNWNWCLHPEKRTAPFPAEGCALKAPDARGHTKDWYLGYDGVKGAFYEVKVRCFLDGTAAHVDVSGPTLPATMRCFMQEPPSAEYHLIGDFVDWKMDSAIEMTWDPVEKRLKGEIVITRQFRQLQEFQIIMNRSWQMCIHPDKRDVSIDERFKLCGPDQVGNGRNWLIGFEGDTIGAKWEVQLRLYADGKPASVRAVRV
mmetsp:Transcript_26038/g.60176  ORF Transcript_26038/g.60176 Transcript_26038/m.60176 type:complete len:509 (-) Transcript_26038:26-1552(-)